MVNVDFLLGALVGLADKLPMVGRILGHKGLGKISLIPFKLPDKQGSGINTCCLGIGNLLLVEHKAVEVLFEGLLLDLLLIVLVISAWSWHERIAGLLLIWLFTTRDFEIN